MVRARACAPRALAASPILLLPGPALAHPGSGLAHVGDDLLLGLTLSLTLAATLLPLPVLGLALAPARRIPWLSLLAGGGAGLCLAGVAPAEVAPLSLAIALVLACALALWGRPLPRIPLVTLAALLPGLALASLYRGGSATPPPAMIIGSLVGACLLILGPALAGRILLHCLPDAAPALALRIAASWLAAILILMLALTLSGQAGMV